MNPPTITFIQPCVGRSAPGPYIKTWLMEPLQVAQLAAVTPPDVRVLFHDDRLDRIRYTPDAGLVAISVETYTARRSYQIADRYRSMGLPVVMGGFHATLCPEEAMEHADALVVGEAEQTWPAVVADWQSGRLRRRYHGAPSRTWPSPRRSVFASRPYLGVSLVEAGRGCRHGCEFCSIAAFFGSSYRPRPADEVAREVAALPRRRVFFVDDNFGADPEHAKAVMEALAPLNVRWMGQVNLGIANDPAMLRLMARSGCVGVLIGFESLESANLAGMGKTMNPPDPAAMEKAVARLHANGTAIYATFVFGYDNDDEATFRRTLDFALKQRFFFAAFNHLVPFPGTPLYRRLKAEGRLLTDPWWLDPGFKFGDVAFTPARMSARRLSDLCFEHRRRFYSLSSIARRALNFSGNTGSLLKAALYVASNIGSRRDVLRRQGLPLGMADDGNAHPLAP